MENCGVEARGRSRQKGGERDLIIRMLAEVFRVRQSEEGTIRWEQVSSSLVPVSLYSRTTESWLNRLTSDLPIGQAASTMSPDSHRLLLLLHLSSSCQKFPKTQNEGAQGNRVVFQVVAHDFHEGRFWTLLNSKITQPGTKLGYGSDYFVYWKDTTNPAMQPFRPSSFASNQSPCCQHLSQSASMNLASSNGPVHVRQTWGLNFASVNDAKLFYDVCSMNPINLSFNPAFLKKFSESIRHPVSSDGGTLIRQKMLRNHTDSDLKSMLANQSNCNATCTGTIQSNTCESFARQHSSASRISSPRKQCQNHHRHSDFVCHDDTRINSCIAQLRQSDMHRSSSSNFRSRSCSTSRRKSSNRQQPLDRNVSRSTHRLSATKGDLSDYGSITNTTATTRHHQLQHQFMGTHNPNCETLLREQELLREHYHFHDYMCPKKPARGQFRDLQQRGSVQQKSSAGCEVTSVTPEVQQVAESRSCGYVSDQASKKSSSRQPLVANNNKMNPSDLEQLDQRTAAKFIESKSNQRRSTAVDASSINRFNASLARANYAKSKNLSLDAGLFQSTPTPTHPVNWNEPSSRKQTIVNEQVCDGSHDGGQEKEKGQEELVPINLANNEVTCIKLHQKSSMDAKTRTQGVPDQEVAEVQDVAHQVQFPCSSTDYQLQVEALNVALPYGFDTNRCEASTTTDDLPLDPVVRKRMFQLSVAKAEKEIADKYGAEQESYLQSERLIRTMAEFTSFHANKTGARQASGPEVRRSADKESCMKQQQPESLLILPSSDIPHPSFSAHRGDLSDSSFVSSPEVEAVPFPMRAKRRVSRPASGGAATGPAMAGTRSKTMPNIRQHQNQDGQDTYTCCLDMIGHADQQNCYQQTEPKTNRFEAVPTIVDQHSPLYHHNDHLHDNEDDEDDDVDDEHDHAENYNYDAMAAMNAHEGTAGHQLCYMQKLSNTLSSVSDFEH